MIKKDRLLTRHAIRVTIQMLLMVERTQTLLETSILFGSGVFETEWQRCCDSSP